MIVQTEGSYFGGLNDVLTATRIDDLPPCEPDFQAVANAADTAMIEVLANDLVQYEAAA